MKYMGQDAVNAVRDAENKASEIERQTQEECAKILRDAKAKAAEMEENARHEALARREEALKAAEAAALEERKLVDGETKAKIADMERAATEKQDEAVRLILADLF